MLARQCSYQEAVDIVLKEVIEVSDASPRKHRGKLLYTPPVEVPGDVLTSEAIQYLQHRGFSKRFVEEKGCRFHEDRIVIPLDGGWYTLRAIGGEEPKYLFPKGFPRGTTVYNYDRHRREKEVGVVEGVFDSWKVELGGYPCVATLGSAVTVEQLKKLSTFKRLVVIPDTDQGGEVFAQKLSKLRRVVLTVVQLDKKDVGEYSSEQISKLWDSKQSFWKVYSHIFSNSGKKGLKKVEKVL